MRRRKLYVEVIRLSNVENENVSTTETRDASNVDEISVSVVEDEDDKQCGE